jgi:hypothetical protein
VTQETAVFDGRSNTRPPADGETSYVPPVLGASEADDGAGLSTLDILRAKAGEVVEFPPHVFENPKKTIRFTCDTTISQKQISSWQRAAMPVQARKKTGPPDLSRLDPIIYFTRCIAEMCTLVEVRRVADGEFYPIVNPRDGEPYTFADTELLQALGGLDRTTAVRRAMNGAEWAIQQHGTELLAAAGYGDLDEDELNGDPQS